MRALALMLAATAPVVAQDARVEQTQVGQPDRSSSAVIQLTEPGRPIQSEPAAARPIAPIAQVTPRDGSRPTAMQVTGERRVATSPTQLSRGGTAEAPTALSRPSQGRTSAAAAPIGGQDRCDPARAVSSARDCSGVIENRAAEFARPNPLTLSPEQRLLVDQRLREANTTNQRTPVVRPGDVSAADPEAPEGQAVASIVRDQIRPDDAKSPMGALPTDDPAGVAAVIDAIVNNPGGQSPPR